MSLATLASTSIALLLASLAGGADAPGARPPNDPAAPGARPVGDPAAESARPPNDPAAGGPRPVAVLVLEATHPAGARCEYFELGPGEGVARLVVLPQGEVRQIELECTFPTEDLVFSQVERVGHRTNALVWRDRGGRRPRSLLARRQDGVSEVELADFAGGAVRHALLSGAGGVRFPLESLESARAGGDPEGSALLLDPLAASVEPIDVRVRAIGTRLALRVLEWTRADGTLAGQFVFAGDELLMFRRQRGGAVALRVSESDYRDALGELRRRVAEEAERAASAERENQRARAAIGDFPSRYPRRLAGPGRVR